MRLQHLLVIPALALGAFAVPAKLFADAPPAKTQPATRSADKMLEAKPFTDPRSGVSLRLPKGWVPKKGIEDTGYEAPAKDRNEIGGLAPNVVIAGDKVPGAKPADQARIVEQNRAQIAKQVHDYRQTRNETRIINGKSVSIIGCTFLAQKVLKIETTQVYIVTEGKIYTVTFATIASASEKNQPLFDAMLETITIP